MFCRRVNHLIFRIVKGMRIALSNCLIVENKQANMKRGSDIFKICRKSA